MVSTAPKQDPAPSWITRLPTITTNRQFRLAQRPSGRKALVVICGAISQYNNTTAVKGPSNYMSLLVNRARMEGMVVFDYAARYGEAVKDIADWLGGAKMISREHVVTGFETFPDTLLMLFRGENTGKLVQQVS